MFRILISAFCILFLSGCAGPAYQLPHVSTAEIEAKQQDLFSTTKPVKVHNRSDKEYETRLAKISKKLTENAGPLCQHCGYESCRFEVSYNNAKAVNAYASEDYKVTVYKGLLQYLQNDDEIAAVIAHEMGHHLAKHNEKAEQNANTGSVVSGVLGAALVGAANYKQPAYYNTYQQQQKDMQLIDKMAKSGAKIGRRSYSKAQEREADLLATYLLSIAGYDLKRAENVMVTLAKFDNSRGLNSKVFLASHPAGVERVVAWEKAIDEISNNPTGLPYPVQYNTE